MLKVNDVNWNLKGQCIIFIVLVVQSIIPPQRCLYYSLWTREHVNLWVKRDFTDMMKKCVMGNDTGLFRWIQCADEDSYKREGRVRKRKWGITKAVQARLRDLKMLVCWFGRGRLMSWAKDCLFWCWGGRDGISPRDSRGCSDLTTPSFGPGYTCLPLVTSVTVRYYICAVLSQ